MTEEDIAKAFRMMPKLPPEQYLALSPRAERRLKDAQPFGPQPNNQITSYYGLPIFVKPGQLADCWIFANRKALQEYLDGKITEQDLVIMAANETPINDSQKT